jgi:hypothetical protein
MASASWHEVTRALVWPQLLRTAGLALRPAHLTLAFFLVVLLILLSRVPDLWLTTASDGTPIINRPSVLVDAALRESTTAFRDWNFSQGLGALLHLPFDLLRSHPWTLALLAIPLAMIWGVFGGAIARSTAWQVAKGERMAWTVAFGQAIAKLVSLVGVLVGPAVGIALLLGAITVFGKFFFGREPTDVLVAAIVVVAMLGLAIIQGALSKRFRVGRIFAAGVLGLCIAGLLLLPRSVSAHAGGVLYVVPLLLSVGVLIFSTISALGLPMLTAGVMIEGNDAIDSVQRVWAYIIQRPGRFAGYLVLLLFQGVLLLALACGVVFTAITLSSWASMLLVGGPAEGAPELRHWATTGTKPVGESFEPWHASTGSILAWWIKVWTLSIFAVVLSFVHAGGATLYLAMRRICDGQDQVDIWDPSSNTRVSAAKIEDAEDGTDLENRA